jgi:hypothetical protein
MLRGEENKMGANVSLKERVQRFLETLEGQLAELDRDKAEAEENARQLESFHRHLEGFSKSLLAFLAESLGHPPRPGSTGNRRPAGEEPSSPEEGYEDRADPEEEADQIPF